jgi:rifampicin phosphotransferase
MSTVRKLEESTDAAVFGGKAANLAKLISLGLNVPPGMALPVGDTAMPVDLKARVLSHLSGASRWAVRSSALVEDSNDTSYAGRFESVIVDDAGELDAAIAAVRNSALRAGLEPETMAVVIQAFVEPDYAGVVFSSDPVCGDAGAVIEYCEGRGEQVVSGTATPRRYRRGDPEADAGGCPLRLLEEIGRTAEEIAAREGYPVDMEWAIRAGTVHWLQLRAITGLVRKRAFEIRPEQAASLTGHWALMEHCVAPVAPLVVSLDPGGYFDGPLWESQVVSGYHYVRQKQNGSLPQDPLTPETVGVQWLAVKAEFESQLDGWLAQGLTPLRAPELWQEIEKRIALHRALFRRYIDPRFFRIRANAVNAVRGFLRLAYGPGGSLEGDLADLLSGLETRTRAKQLQIGELVRLARQDPRVLTRTVVEPPSAASTQWDRAWQRLIAEFGYEAANTQLFYLPTLRETPETVMRVIRAAAALPNSAQAADTSDAWATRAVQVRAKLAEAQRAQFDQQLEIARVCMLRTEDDDYLIQKASATIRHVLLEAGLRGVASGLLKEPGEVFFLDGPELRRGLERGSWPVERETLLARRAVFEHAKETRPPYAIVDGRPVSEEVTSAAGALRGQAASSGRASGRVFVVGNPLESRQVIPAGSVVVTSMLTPALAYALLGCVAIVTEVGGFSSHGAIVAREMGIPAVVGLHAALSCLHSGSFVTVDGDAGEVRPLSGREAAPARTDDCTCS